MIPNDTGEFDLMVNVVLPCQGCLREVLWVRSEFGGGPAADSCVLLALAAADPHEDRPEWTDAGNGRWRCAEFTPGTAAAVAAHDQRQTEQAWRDAGQMTLGDVL